MSARARDDGDIPSRLENRTLADVLARLAEREGALTVEDGGTRGKILIRGGHMVSVRVVGRFDPVIARLCREGELDERQRERMLAALCESEQRSGSLAAAIGVCRSAVRRALDAQARDALAVLAALGPSAALAFHPRRIEAREVCAFLPLSPSPASPAHSSRGRASPGRSSRGLPHPNRRALRAAALQLHPDRTHHLPPEERARRTALFVALSARR